MLQLLKSTSISQGTKMKPTKEQFYAYLQVQYSGITNMYHGTRVADLALEFTGEELSQDTITYIIRNYQALKEEYGDIEQETLELE